ncbi:hypothetical protein ABW20_dc0106240 [Dactylellina cionopaga]|nr:hypothetical protein ABW20_dc0106240 [Dactylellina cionopaga]
MPRKRSIRSIMMDYVPSAQYAREDYKAEHYDLSDLCIKHIQTHLKSAELYRAQLAELLNTAQTDGVPALTTIAINSMISSLREDPSPSNFETVINHAPESLLNSIIDSPKLHYTSMMRFAEQKGWDKLKDDSKRDIWILKNEYFIRADGTDWGLLNLDDSDIVFGHSSKLVTNDAGEPIYREITRKIAPKSGVQYLDQKRQRTLKIQPSTAAFQATFNRLMGGALDGLDWNNILVAGGMPLSTLLCVDESMDESYKKNDIDMYIYGLTPEKATEKIKHIAEVWKKNLKTGDDFIMIKNARTVTLIAAFPHRRVQIIMKMVKTPAAVLLNFDLDQVAIGYTGESVLLLPRCARALETGYAIFTLDMIHGHHLNERRETQEERLLKYAKRGFGVRILPEFCELVEIDFGRRLVTRPFVDQAAGDIDLQQREQWYVNSEETPARDLVSGVKAVRRVFAAGEDMVYRFYLGRTEVSAPDDYEGDEDFYSDPENTNTDYYRVDYTDPDTGEKTKVPKGEFSALDTYRSGVGAPHGKRGLGSLEMHARHCALFRFDHEKKMVVDYDTMASTTYDVESYDMLPKYDWDEEFSPSTFMKQIDTYNDNLFHKFCDALENDDGVANSARAARRNWKNHLRGYLTRRIRRICYSKDINELVDRFQIVLPVYAPFKLEEWIKETFSQALEDAGIASHNYEILIPVHKPGMGDGVLADITESTEENLRYWVIDSTTIWAGIDRRIDEIFEVLWVLCLTNDLVTDGAMGYGSRQDAAKEWYGIVAKAPARDPTSDDQGHDREYIEAKKPETVNPLIIPNERDQYLFTKWLIERPVEIYRNYQYEVHSSYREHNNATAPPEIMYWREGIDGTSNEWTDWPENQTGFEPIATFRKQPGKKLRSDGRSNSDDDWADGLPEDAGGDDAEGEPAPDGGDDAGATAGTADGPRGVKRPREASDLTDMMGPSGAGVDDTTMADAPGEGSSA